MARLGFHALPPPTDEDVEAIAARVVARVRRLLESRDGDAVDDEPDSLAHAQAEAVQLPMSLAERVPRTYGSRRRCALLDGFSLQRSPRPHRARAGLLTVLPPS